MKVIILLLSYINNAWTMDEATVDLLTPKGGEACGYLACPETAPDKINIHIVPHTHGELGVARNFHQHYTGKIWGNITHIANMKNILDKTITELWEDNKRKFTLFDTPYLFHWWANRDGTVRRMVYELLRQGRLYFVGGGWSMSDEATTSYHGIIDQFTYALRKFNATFLECGRPLVTWQADVFGHSREFASLMAQMGFDGHFINPISLEDELNRMAQQSLEFVWRGSDDIGAESDIFTHKLFDGYWSPPGFCFGSHVCQDPYINARDSLFNNAAERAKEFIKSMQKRQGPNYKTRHLMVMMGQQFGYYDAGNWFSNIDALIRAVNEISWRNITLYYSTPACYLKAIHYENPALSTKQDDFFPYAYDVGSYAAGMYSSRPTIKYMAREGHAFMQIAKQIQIVSNISYNAAIFEELFWINGVIQDHNIITGAMTNPVKRYYTHKMYNAVQKSTVVIRLALNKLRKCHKEILYYRCGFNESICWSTNSQHSYIVIYNVLAWPVTLPVRLPIKYAKYTVFAPNGSRLNTTILPIPTIILNLPDRSQPSDHELIFLAENLPPLGYRSYLIIKDRERNRRSILKKLKKKKKSKYFTKQINNMKIDEDSLLETMIPEYESFEDMTTVKANTNALTNISKNDDIDDFIDVETSTNKTVTVKHEIEDVTVKYRKMDTNNFILNKMDAYNKNDNDDQDKDFYRESQDLFIENKYVKLNLDKSQKIKNIVLSNGVTMSLNIDMFFYASDDPQKLNKLDRKNPGVYFFRPMDPQFPEFIKDYLRVKVLKTNIVEEIQYTFADYAYFAVRIYQDKPYIEIDWVVGPIPIDDEVGKDVFIRYSTDLKNYGVFYTDSNGRQTIKRLRNIRATYRPSDIDRISGNLYPVTSKIYIEDTTKNIRCSIFNDRSQAGGSLNEGQIDLLVHRRILTDETGLLLYLNETVDNKGIIVRGTHYLYVSKADYKPNKIFEKKFAKEIELIPKILASTRKPYGTRSPTAEWTKYKNEFSAIRIKLPIGVHILTLEQWNDDTLLMRLENYLEEDDIVRNGLKKVFLWDLFHNIEITSIKETTLGANIWLKDWVPLQWRKSEKFVKNFNKCYGVAVDNLELCEDEELKPFEEVNINSTISLKPQQIRTFVVGYKFVGL